MSEVELLWCILVVDDICVEVDLGGYIDGGVVYSLMFVMILLRDEMMKKY